MPPGACVIFSDNEPFRPSPGSVYLTNLYVLTDALFGFGLDGGVGNFGRSTYLSNCVVSSSSVCLDFGFDFFVEGVPLARSQRTLMRGLLGLLFSNKGI